MTGGTFYLVAGETRLCLPDRLGEFVETALAHRHGRHHRYAQCV